jgi:hypothetical protein
MDEYTSRVQRGREALHGARRNLWALADIAAEFPSPPDTRFGAEGDDAHRQEQGLYEWAEAIGISPKRARDYRATALAWPPEQRREDRNFQLHVELRDRVDRVKMLEGNEKLRDLRPVDRITDEQAKQHIIKNPELAREAARESAEVGREAGLGQLEHGMKEYQDRNPAGFADMQKSIAAQHREEVDREWREAQAHLNSAIIHLQNALTYIRKGKFHDDEDFRRNVEMLRTYLGLLDSFLENEGEVDWDAALARLTRKDA